jgi:hypothetical protein
MLELISNTLSFNFPEVHPAARVGIVLHRTLRIPDDDKTYPLPPSLGSFPVRHIEDFKARLPEKWLKRGGVMIPLFQSEAAWISFQPNHDPATGKPYPFAIKVAAGKQSAITGKEWSKKLKEKDYVVAPPQPWIDGYVVEEGLIRQFVAMPLGGGFTVEEQLTGKAEFGGIQLEVIPMKRSEYDRRFPKLPPRPVMRTRSMMRGQSLIGESNAKGGFESMSFGDDFAPVAAAASYNCVELCEVSEMGMGAGGRMKQQIFDDPYGLSNWDTDHKTRCFVHLANSMLWRRITSEDPPHPPLTAADYTSRGFPWYDHYSDGPTLKGGKKLQGIKTVKEIGQQKGVPSLPENTPLAPHNILMVTTLGKQVKDGVWK